MFILAYIIASRVYPIEYKMECLCGVITLVVVSGLVLHSQPVVLKALTLGAYVALVAGALFVSRRNRGNSVGVIRNDGEDI